MSKVALIRHCCFSDIISCRGIFVRRGSLQFVSQSYDQKGIKGSEIWALSHV